MVLMLAYGKGGHQGQVQPASRRSAGHILGLKLQLCPPGGIKRFQLDLLVASWCEPTCSQLAMASHGVLPSFNLTIGPGAGGFNGL